MNHCAAVTVRNLPHEHTLELHWRDGTLTSVPHCRLRVRCRCAHCHAAQARTGQSVSAMPGVTLLQVERVGAYGLRLFFSDGHSRGIYPWGYLRELAEVERGPEQHRHILARPW